MPVRAVSVWRQISERADKKPLSLPSVNGELANKAVDRRLQRQAHAHFPDHVLFARKVEVGLHRRCAKHHVEAAGSDFRHIASHDRIAAFWHDRRFCQRPFWAHAKGEKADPERLGHLTAGGQMTIKFRRRSMRVFERRAGKLELPSRLERNGALAVRVVEADQVSVVLDAVPTKTAAHAFQQRPDRRARPHKRRGASIGAVEWDLLVLRADPERA